MKIKFLHFFKLTLALLLFVPVGKVSAQTITFSKPTDNNLTNGHVASPCGDVTGAVVGGAYYSNSIPFTATASVPVTSMSFLVASIDDLETHTFNAGGITNEVISVSPDCSSLVTINGNQVKGVQNITLLTRITISSVTPFTTVSMSSSSSAAFILKAGAVASKCTAGTTAPSLTTNTPSNTCPANTVNLNSLLSSSATATQVSMLKWYTDAAHTSAVADATQAPAGTYYAFYYDSTNDCYSPATAAVTATVAACCPTAAPTVN